MLHFQIFKKNCFYNSCRSNFQQRVHLCVIWICNINFQKRLVKVGLPLKSMLVFFKSHIWHTNAFFLRFLLRHDFIVFIQKVQKMFKFYEVFEDNRKDNLKKFHFCFCFIFFCLITISKATTVGRGTSTFIVSFLKTGKNVCF